ncbi:MAG TPA: hypothetical protein VFC46_18170 [Humisphaera sp.]|nr:hypothetical protein [Humisphaera sp.]
MGQPRVKWGQAERYFLKRGYEIRSAGGEKIVVAPAGHGDPRARQTVRVGHTSCNSPGSELLRCYLSAFNRVFKVSIQDILND